MRDGADGRDSWQSARGASRQELPLTGQYRTRSCPIWCSSNQRISASKPCASWSTAQFCHSRSLQKALRQHSYVKRCRPDLAAARYRSPPRGGRAGRTIKMVSIPHARTRPVAFPSSRRRCAADGCHRLRTRLGRTALSDSWTSVQFRQTMATVCSYSRRSSIGRWVGAATREQHDRTRGRRNTVFVIP